MIPNALGRSSFPENLRAIHAFCNTQRGNALIEAHQMNVPAVGADRGWDGLIAPYPRIVAVAAERGFAYSSAQYHHARMRAFGTAAWEGALAAGAESDWLPSEDRLTPHDQSRPTFADGRGYRADRSLRSLVVDILDAPHLARGARLTFAHAVIFLGSSCVCFGTFMQAWIDTGELRSATGELEAQTQELAREQFVIQAKRYSRPALMLPWRSLRLRKDAREAAVGALTIEERSAIATASLKTTAWSIMGTGTFAVAVASWFG